MSWTMKSPVTPVCLRGFGHYPLDPPIDNASLERLVPRQQFRSGCIRVSRQEQTDRANCLGGQLPLTHPQAPDHNQVRGSLQHPTTHVRLPLDRHGGNRRSMKPWRTIP